MNAGGKIGGKTTTPPIVAFYININMYDMHTMGSITPSSAKIRALHVSKLTAHT